MNTWMKYIQIAHIDFKASNIVMGCMRINSLSLTEIDTLVKTAMDQGINFFDHADIYGKGTCEALFSQAIGMNSALREQMIIQSKCCIRNGFYDASKEYILSAVEGILQRLQTDYLDILLLHRPDALVEPEEVAEAFDRLHSSGKVRSFGVSNYNPMQIELLKRYISYPLIINQLQYSVAHTPLTDEGMAVNMFIDQAISRTGYVMDYCRLHDMTIQAWSPFQKGFFEGPFFLDAQYAALNEALMNYGQKYELDLTGAAVAWITRHPANIQVILGTTRPERLIACCKGSNLPMSREEWYGIYKAAGNSVP
jgi:predicted oxidoreductase